MNQSLSPRIGRDSELARWREELSLRLDDLRGFGILGSGTDPLAIEGEEALIQLCLALVDALESTQRRVIETSIQILSIRELVTKLLSLRTPEEVAETVTLYLQKAFDHERVLVGVYYPAATTLEGWLAIRSGTTECFPFRLEGEWSGALRTSLDRNAPARQSTAGTPFLLGRDLPAELEMFGEDHLGPYLAYPLSGRGQKSKKVVGILMVGQATGGKGLDDMEEGILQSVAEAVGTAMENVILEEDVRREAAFRKDIMGSMSSGLIACDLQGHVLTMNPEAETLTQFTLIELRGNRLTGMDPSGGGLAELLKKTLDVRQPILRVERAVRRADGSAFPTSCATSLLRNPEGDVYGAIVTFTDLTQIKTMEQSIRSLDRLAALGRFTAGIAHEIRNPLTGIGTGVQYLERHTEGDPEQTENLRFIQREIGRLNRIIEDLFRVTHPHPLRKAPENPRQMVELAVQSLGDLPDRRRVEVEYCFAPDLPRVPVDPDQIQQVLLNLLKNAIEATPEGGRIEVHVYPSPEETRPQVVFQILDSGPGIDPEALPHVFEPFFTKGKPDGTGLGLYVSHGIVERHGGELHAANKNQSGAIFSLMLPLDTYDTTEML